MATACTLVGHGRRVVSGAGVRLARPVTWTATRSVSHAKLYVEKTAAPKPMVTDSAQLGFGKYYTDHMLSISWAEQGGWNAPQITPFTDLSLSPGSLVFHYALECFEGMKAYRGVDDGVRMFRPDLNMKRLNKSATRLAMPVSRMITVDEAEFRKCIEHLVQLDKDWIPRGRGFSLYIRPTLIATRPILGVSATSSARLFVILSPVGPYFPAGFKPVRLLADPKYVRAWPGGTGDIKCGGNYAATIFPQRQAASNGFDQILWLFGAEQKVTEVGTMNFFVFWKNDKGEKELITPPLDGTILPGVTRQTILDLSRKWGEFKVSERDFSMPELAQAVHDGRVLEAFGAGTAATVSPVKEIFWNNRALQIPMAKGNVGVLTDRLLNTIFDIQYGVVPSHEWAPRIA